MARGTERLPVARKSAALMSFSSGTNSPGLGILEIEGFVMVVLLRHRVALVGVFTALTERAAQM
ncbi:hypothetical protein GCM10017674_71720 [Streptomyces gardneri]|uniref:Uncharacterized protein n=1 Tax=Streptomyces gardneri TaxID=66892 RepID=A0A4Y3RFM9_9ACTN|nr:hypothetical protein SGA01_13030 [Streptomyces gardneri]GHH19128.1 hypothetical protein GCM10017674_71720 [Streptomyces gardneri]